MSNNGNPMQSIPYVGMPATMSINGDSYGGSIAEIKRNGRTLVFVRNQSRSEFTLRSDGSYREKGCSFVFLSLGHAEERRDPHF
jgi:hypothetical protein